MTAKLNVTVKQASRYRAEIAQLKKLIRSGEGNLSTHISNIAATYRMAGNWKLAFEWWRRAAASGDADAFLELGYCLQYGIGIRQNIRAAVAAYRRAASAKWIAPYDQEEAHYHLAVAYLDLNKSRRGRTRASKLLRIASADGDYPQAADLLMQVKNNSMLSICRCRRGLRRSLGGKAQCALHAGNK